MLERPGQVIPPSGGRPLDRRKQFSLLIVRGDGARILRVNVPFSFTVFVVALVATIAAAVGLVTADRWWVHARLAAAGDLVREVDAQRARLGAVGRRVAELRTEIASWRDVHARIREPFGPESESRVRSTGIGGARAIERDAPRRADGEPEDVNRLAEAVLAEGENLRALERLVTSAAKALASLPSRWPVRGAVNSEFGRRQSLWSQGGEFHSGIDIAAERGTPVVAPAAGTVAFAGSHAEYGLTVMLDHGDELLTVYGHLSRLSVERGRTVARGAELGFTGNSGRSSGPHLHYEILVKGRPVNPRTYLWD